MKAIIVGVLSAVLLAVGTSAEPDKGVTKALDELLENARVTEKLADKLQDAGAPAMAGDKFREALAMYQTLRDAEPPVHRSVAIEAIRRIEGRLFEVSSSEALDKLVQKLRTKVAKPKSRMPGAKAEWEEHDAMILMLAEEVLKLRREVQALKEKRP